MLKYKNERIVSDHDWDALVVNTYNRPYCFQQQDGCKERGNYELIVPNKYPEDYDNDTVPEICNHSTMGVSFKAWLERDPKQSIKDSSKSDFTNLWWTRNFYPTIEMIANDLYEKGLIEAGEYTIRIDW